MVLRASDCYEYRDDDPLKGNALHAPSGDTVEVFLVLRYESGKVACVGSNVAGSLNPDDFVDGDVSDFQWD